MNKITTTLLKISKMSIIQVVKAVADVMKEIYPYL